MVSYSEHPSAPGPGPAPSSETGPSPAFRALADPTRRSILDGLARAPEGRTAGAISAEYDVSRPAISKHLRVLETSGLVRVERDGRRRVYRLDPAPLEAVDRWVTRYRMFWAPRLAAIKQQSESAAREAAGRQANTKGGSDD